MLDDKLTRQLTILFEEWADVGLRDITELGANGSNRRYFRLVGVDGSHQCIGAFNDCERENRTFVYYSQAMCQRGLPVPAVYAVSDDALCYLQQDLGDTTLYDCLRAKRQKGGGFDAEMVSLYKQALEDLVRIQTECQDLDFSKAYPRAEFDRQSMQWDLQYFKYYFLKLRHITFDEQLLEDDFTRLISFLLDEDCRYFMYRDFQSRNIMVQSDDNGKHKLYYIDFQGGRRGAPQYDVASILFSAKSDLPDSVRTELLNHYLVSFERYNATQPSERQIDFDRNRFLDRFYGYVLIRILQALGAYGYRGYFERKPYFLESIPMALRNLRAIVESSMPQANIPHLHDVLLQLVQSQPSVFTPTNQLTVTVGSFSYKKGLPDDETGNGGGFVFDCRALPNPGRYDAYRLLTGRDHAVAAFLGNAPEVEQFINHASAMVSQSVTQYQERHFTHLAVWFGCTGGQHRSVYCAERLSEYLKKQFPKCPVKLVHREQM